MSQRLTAVFAALLVLASVALLGRSAAEAQQTAPNPRIALVIGNATYRDAALATSANDAGLVAQTLQAAGFDVVGARDLDGQSLRTAFRDFLQKAVAAGPDLQAFVYLSGRGVQYAGDNYFVPVDAVINRDADVPIEALRVSDFSHALAATPGRAHVIVLDAARANPYAAQGSPLAPGLALVDPEPGELIAFNAAPGTLAGDEQGPYGVYAKTLAGAIRQGGVDIAQAFDQTRVLVNSETQGALLPWSASKLDGPFYVFERAADAPPAIAPPPAETDRRPISGFPLEEAYAAALERDTIEGYREFLATYPDSDQANRVRAILAVRREAAYWRRTAGADTPHAYWTYLRIYPRGAHVADARRRLAMLSAEFEPPADFEPETFVDLPPPPPEELVFYAQPIYAFDDFGPPPPPPPVQFVYVEDDDWLDLPPPPPPAYIGVLPVLGFALPVAVGAVAFQGLYHRDGIAPRGEPRWLPPPPAPPPLPANIKPVAPPPPVALAAPAANAAVVKPLRPIGRPPAPGAPASAPAKPPGGAPTAAAPPNRAGTAAPAAPGPAPKPSPVPPAGNPPAAALPVAGTKPGGSPPPAGGGAPAAQPPAAAAAPNAPATPGKPSLAPVGAKPPGTPPPAAGTAPIAPAAPGGKPLPTPLAPVGAKPPGTGPSPAATAAPGGKRLPAPTAPPSPVGAKPPGTPPPAAATAPIAPAVPGRKPLPAPLAPVGAKPPGTGPSRAATAPTAPAAPGGKPLPAPTTPGVVKPGGATAPLTPAPAPVVHAPAPPPATPPVVHAPAAPVVRAPPTPVVRAPPPPRPPPVVHAPAPPIAAAPPAPRPPPVVYAPAPRIVAAPPAPRAPPVVYAPAPRIVAAPPAPRPPPVARAPQGPAQPRACGAPGLPPCPK
jgi:uncharacterized caspase-like protein